MYFDQYFIKPAFATLTSLLRTFPALTSRLPLYIFGFQFQKALVVFLLFRPFQSFLFAFCDIRRFSFLSFPFDWECKGRNLFLTSK